MAAKAGPMIPEGRDICLCAQWAEKDVRVCPSVSLLYHMDSLCKAKHHEEIPECISVLEV